MFIHPEECPVLGDPGFRREASESGAAGLVSYKTSVTVTPSPRDITVFRHELRLRRMRRSVKMSAELLQQEACDKGCRTRAALFTGTYRDDEDWQPWHITAFISRVRAWLARKGHHCLYLWVLELTKSGRTHYHVMFWLPKGLTLPKPDKRGWWPWGLTRIEWARSPVGYLVKYSSKGVDGNQLPKGARLHGCGGLSLQSRRLRAYRLLPAWVRDVFTLEDRPARPPGGGWVSRLTGHFEPSRWRLLDHCPRWSWVRIVEVASVTKVAFVTSAA